MMEDHSRDGNENKKFDPKEYERIKQQQAKQEAKKKNRHGMNVQQKLEEKHGFMADMEPEEEMRALQKEELESQKREIKEEAKVKRQWLAGRRGREEFDESFSTSKERLQNELEAQHRAKNPALDKQDKERKEKLKDKWEKPSWKDGKSPER